MLNSGQISTTDSFFCQTNEIYRKEVCLIPIFRYYQRKAFKIRQKPQIFIFWQIKSRNHHSCFQFLLFIRFLLFVFHKESFALNNYGNSPQNAENHRCINAKMRKRANRYANIVENFPRMHCGSRHRRICALEEQF